MLKILFPWRSPDPDCDFISRRSWYYTVAIIRRDAQGVAYGKLSTDDKGPNVLLKVTEGRFDAVKSIMDKHLMFMGYYLL